MLRYVFMGSPELAVTILQKLTAEYHPPVLIVTQEPKAAGRGRELSPTAVESWARSQGREVLAVPNVNEATVVERMRAVMPEVILVAAFGQILKEPILTLPRLHCLNVHASLLPKYRGAAPAQRAIWNGDKITGVTLQKMAKRLDTGDILLTRETAIEPEETSGELLERLAKIGGEAAIEALRLLESGKAKFTPQDENKATHAAKIDKADGVIDWNAEAAKIHDQIRALNPWPVAETTLGNEKLRVFRSRIAPGTPGREPGDILTDHRGFLHVQCGGNTALSLTEIQLANRKKLDVKQFLQAYRGAFPHARMESPSR